jgi:hypothetical protein
MAPNATAIAIDRGRVYLGRSDGTVIRHSLEAHPHTPSMAWPRAPSSLTAVARATWERTHHSGASTMVVRTTSPTSRRPSRAGSRLLPANRVGCTSYVT